MFSTTPGLDTYDYCCIQSYGSIRDSWGAVSCVTQLPCSRFNASNGHILSSYRNANTSQDTNKYFSWTLILNACHVEENCVTFDENQGRLPNN